MGRQACKRTLCRGMMPTGLLRVGLLMGGLLMGGCAADRPDVNAPSSSDMTLTSTAFVAEGLIPAKFTCDGENISPALAWNPPPTGTKSLALVVEDSDAPSQTFIHWVLYDLPPDIHRLPEKVLPQPFLKQGGVQGKSSFGQYGYGGPCPPNGTHQYIFKLYALNQIMDLPPGTTQADLLKAMQSHILAKAYLAGKYTRQK